MYFFIGLILAIIYANWAVYTGYCDGWSEGLEIAIVVLFLWPFALFYTVSSLIDKRRG